MSKDVILGKAKIPYADKTFVSICSCYANGYTPPSGRMDAGWVLPGGARTTNREQAVLAAQIMHDLMEKK